MKKSALILICFSLIISLFGCNSDMERTDELAVPFVEAMLKGDENGMKNYIHPDYTESAMPDEDFYSNLESNHFFTMGNDLTMLTAIGKNYVEDTEIEGELIQCLYVIMSNELYYNVELMILDNDNGYGVIAVSVSLNTEPRLYAQSEGEQN